MSKKKWREKEAAEAAAEAEKVDESNPYKGLTLPEALNKLVEKDKLIEARKDENDKTKDELEKKEAFLNDKKVEFDDAIKNLKAQHETELNKVKGEKVSLENELSKVKDEKNSLNNELNDLKKEKASLEAELDKMKSERDSLTDELKKARSKTDSLADELVKLNKKEGLVEDELNDLKKEKASLEAELDERNESTGIADFDPDLVSELQSADQKVKKVLGYIERQKRLRTEKAEHERRIKEIQRELGK